MTRPVMSPQTVAPDILTRDPGVQATMLPAVVRRLVRLQAPGSLAVAARSATGVPGVRDDAVDPGALVSLRLERAWPRRPGHLLLDYALPDGTRVAGQWFAGSDRDAGRDTESLDGLRRATARTAAVPGAVVVDPGSGVVLQAGGADRRLTGLASLASRDGARLVAHRPERRGVVRLVDPVRWVKVVRRDRALPCAAPVGPREVAVARLLDASKADGSTTWSHVAGRTLHDLLRSGLDASRQAAVGRAVGAAVRRVHDVVPGGLDHHGPDDELAVVTTWGQRLADHLDDDPVARCLPQVQGVLADTEPGPTATLHRDLHDKQVLVDEDDQVGLIDFDTVAAGEGVLDLANLLVHLELRVRQERVATATAATIATALLDGYGWSHRHDERLRAYAATTRVRLAAVYAFRPRWAHLCRDLLEGAFTAPPGLG